MSEEKSCFRYHEDRICENDSCQVLECDLRHPRKCHWFLDFYYCKFGSFCKFSHKTNKEGKAIEEIEKELNLIKIEIDEKEKEIKKFNEMIKGMEEKTRDEIDIIRHKNEAIEKEMKDLKAKNETIESRFIVMEKEIEQAGAELGQAQLPTGILLYCD